jgi:chemotaxis response regulator CheB
MAHRGAAQIKRRGGQLVVQDPATAASFAVLAAAWAAAQTAHVRSLDQIANTVNEPAQAILKTSP